MAVNSISTVSGVQDIQAAALDNRTNEILYAARPSVFKVNAHFSEV